MGRREHKSLGPATDHLLKAMHVMDQELEHLKEAGFSKHVSHLKKQKIFFGLILRDLAHINKKLDLILKELNSDWFSSCSGSGFCGSGTEGHSASCSESFSESCTEDFSESCTEDLSESCTESFSDSECNFCKNTHKKCHKNSHKSSDKESHKNSHKSTQKNSHKHHPPHPPLQYVNPKKFK